MNTKHVEDRAARKKLKREARKKAPAKAKRASGVARGSNKKKVQNVLVRSSIYSLDPMKIKLLLRDVARFRP